MHAHQSHDPRAGRQFVARLATVAVAAALSLAAVPAAATAAYDGHRLYALSTTSTSGRLVPFDVGPGGQLTERSDQAITVAGATTGLLVDRRARSVFVSSRDVYSGGCCTSTPGMIAVYRIAADGSLTLAQTVTSSRFAMALAPDGSRLFAQKLNGELDSYAVLADGTLGPETAPFPFTQPANSLALSPDGDTLYMDGQNALFYQWSIGAGFALTFLSPGGFGMPCYSPFIGFAQGTDHVDFQCYNGNGYTYTAGPDGALTPNGGAFASTDGQHGTVEDVRGRAFYSGHGYPGIAQLARQPNGRLVPFPVAAVTSPSTPRALAADPDGATLTAATATSGMATYAIAADGSLSSSPIAVTPIVMSPPSFLVYSPQQAPVAAFGTTQAADGSTRFDAAATLVSGGRSAQYEWTFGDGTTLVTTGPVVSHTYPAPGTYTAALRVTDGAGCSVANTFSGSMGICAGSPAAAATATVRVVAPAAAPAPLAAVTAGVAAPAEAARPLAATAVPDVTGRKVLLTWATPAGAPEATRYLIAWSTLHSSQGPGDPNMHHLRVTARTSIVMRTRPRTTLHLAVYAYLPDGSLTRATKTTVRLPR